MPWSKASLCVEKMTRKTKVIPLYSPIDVGLDENIEPIVNSNLVLGTR